MKNECDLVEKQNENDGAQEENVAELDTNEAEKTDIDVTPSEEKIEPKDPAPTPTETAKEEKPIEQKKEKKQKTENVGEEATNNAIDTELLVKLVNLHNSGWFDMDLRKQIKPTPKGWQLLQV